MIRRAILLVIALAAVPKASESVAQELADDRPRIGLALSGGGARGLAHVGVLEVLEELRVPIDVITGTSMGAIVGGLYASGLPADSIRGLLSHVDWEEILSDTPPRSSIDFAHRARQRRDTVEIEIGLSRDGPTLPSGLISGQELGLLLRRVTLPVAAVEDFTRLPIPFAAVATDIATLEPIVLDTGDLVESMRASMAIPVVFAPVELDGRLLVDGGLVNNLPVDLARQMGADVVIAVDASPPLLEREELSGILGVSEQLTRHLGRQGVERQLASADVVMELDLDGLGLFDFRRSEEIVARGAGAARAHAARLAPLSLPPAEYTAHRSARDVRQPEPPAQLSGVSVNAPEWLDERLALSRVDPRLFREFDPDVAETAVRRVHAIGELERVGYDIESATEPPPLVIDAHGKPRGPNLLLFGIDLVTDSAGESPARLAFDGIASYVRTRIGARAAELTVDVRAGTTSGIEVAYRQPLDFGGHWFVEPSALAVEVQRSVFSGETSGTEYETGRALLGVDVGRALGLSGEVRIGVRGGRETSELDPPSSLSDGFPTVAENAAEAHASIVVDQLDAVGIPRRGVYGSALVRASREELGAERSWTAVSLDGRAYWSRGPHTLFIRGSGGASSPARRLPVHEEFLLGGFGSLGGYGEGEIRGEAFVAGRTGWLRRVAELPPALRAVVAGGWLEAGDAWDSSVDEEIDPRVAGTVAVGAETLLGPIFLAWSRAEGGRGRVTVSIGRSP